MATAVAARTQRLHVGTSVILLPLHHPVRIAKDVITLDIVSKGRVILGVGIGYQANDFRTFAVPMEHRVGRFEESVEILRKCWSGEAFSFHGTHYQLDDVQGESAPAHPDASTATVDWRQRASGSPPGRTACRRLCRYAKHGHRQHRTVEFNTYRAAA